MGVFVHTLEPYLREMGTIMYFQLLRVKECSIIIGYYLRIIAIALILSTNESDFRVRSGVPILYTKRLVNQKNVHYLYELSKK